ncbi:hypothetical protein VTG60DRAFT_4253 [Thermothelomyces hinnuleus]
MQQNSHVVEEAEEINVCGSQPRCPPPHGVRKRSWLSRQTAAPRNSANNIDFFGVGQQTHLDTPNFAVSCSRRWALPSNLPILFGPVGLSQVQSSGSGSGSWGWIMTSTPWDRRPATVSRNSRTSSGDGGDGGDAELARAWSVISILARLGNRPSRTASNSPPSDETRTAGPRMRSSRSDGGSQEAKTAGRCRSSSNSTASVLRSSSSSAPKCGSDSGAGGGNSRSAQGTW